MKTYFPLCKRHILAYGRRYNEIAITTCEECMKEEKEFVDHPSHYNKGVEVIDFIESWDMDFNTGNVVKYVSRHKLKGRPLEDLQKAKWYIERLIDNAKKERG